MARANHLHQSERYRGMSESPRCSPTYNYTASRSEIFNFSVWSVEARECRMPANLYRITYRNGCFLHKTLLRAQFAAVRSRLANIQLWLLQQSGALRIITCDKLFLHTDIRFLALQWQRKKRIVMAPKCDHAKYIVYRDHEVAYLRNLFFLLIFRLFIKLVFS